jgi:hypothetical protein
MTIYAYRYLEGFGAPIDFSSTPLEGNEMATASFPSVDPATIKVIEEAEVDVGIQVMPPKRTSSSQTGFSFKRNKTIQYESQHLSAEEAQVYLDLPVTSVELKVPSSLSFVSLSYFRAWITHSVSAADKGPPAFPVAE